MSFCFKLFASHVRKYLSRVQNAAKAPHLIRNFLSKRRQLCFFVEVIVVTVFKKKKSIEVMPEVQSCWVPPLCFPYSTAGFHFSRMEVSSSY